MDRENLIDALALIAWNSEPKNAQTITEVISLLKEQEAVEPRYIDGKHNHFIKCGNCNYDLVTGYLFCPHCGKAVKWE